MKTHSFVASERYGRENFLCTQTQIFVIGNNVGPKVMIKWPSRGCLATSINFIDVSPEMHFIVKTRRFAHFIMKTPAGKRPIPPKPMSTKGLTKASAPTAVFSPRTHQSCPAHGKNSRVFTANSRKIHGLFFSMFFTHKKPSLMHLGHIFSILKIYNIYSWGI